MLTVFLGPPGSEITKYGVEITDHPLVAVTMTLMARVGKEALDAIEAGAWFLPCLHSVGRPLEPVRLRVPSIFSFTKEEIFSNYSCALNDSQIW